MERVGKGRDYRSGRKREIGRFAENLEKHVGLSNILNSELNRRKPVEGPHGQVVGTAVVKGKLL